MERKIILRDGREVTIRPIEARDIDGSLAFFAALDSSERRYLRRDVTLRDVVATRIEESEGELVDRIVALVDDEIVADASLERDRLDWERSVGEIRLFVASQYRRVGLGTLMARELYTLAHRHELERIKARVMRPQKAARKILHELGFHEAHLVPNEVRDRDGVWQDLFVMRAELSTLWDEIEHAVHSETWQSQD